MNVPLLNILKFQKMMQEMKQLVSTKQRFKEANADFKFWNLRGILHLKTSLLLRENNAAVWRSFYQVHKGPSWYHQGYLSMDVTNGMHLPDREVLEKMDLH